jgi:phosphoribosylamine---glycine ligase
MRILVIGSGGREHALTWKLRESLRMEEIYCAPGNAGIAQEAECVPVDVSKPAALLELAKWLKADLTVIGPEAPLVAGVVDEFDRAGLRVIGPAKAAARLEGSKIFAKEFMTRHGIPTPRCAIAETFGQAIEALAAFRWPLVIKADGLAAGKGVVIAQSPEEAAHTLDDFMQRKTLGAAGERVVIEECLTGEEASFIVLTDGQGVIELAPAQDHKRLLDGDAGPNTGGMGAYSDDAILGPVERDEIMKCVVRPTLAGLAAEGIHYRGFLYCGLMMTADGPQVLEYNVRLGDPEAQPIMMRLRSDLVDLLLAARDGTLASLEAHWTPNPSVCVVLASAGYPANPQTGQEIMGYEAAESAGGVKLFHAGTRVEDHKLVTAGGRVLGVTAVGEAITSAIQRAYAAVEKIHFDGMQYRRDIGRRGLDPRRLRSRPEGALPLPPGSGYSAAPKLPTV